MYFLIRSVMDSDRTRKLKAWFLVTSRYAWRRKGLWLRAALCWLIGLLFILADSEPDYDTRLKLRGEQPADQQIVLVHIKPAEWSKLIKISEIDPKFNLDSSAIPDSFYWDPVIWEQILKSILNEDPMAIAVALYFGQNIPPPNAKDVNLETFQNPKIIWSSQLSEQGHILPSRFAKAYGRNSGLNEFAVDRDGILRRFSYNSDKIPHLATQTAQHALRISNRALSALNSNSPIINFRGPENTFAQMSLSDLMTHRFPSYFFKNKIVILGATDASESDYLTPVGSMSRAEIAANIVDNIKNDRWVKRPHFIVLSLIILLFVLLTASITSNYPQLLAFFIICFTSLFFGAISVWIFDSYYIWLPNLAITLVSFVTYIIFLSFQLTLKEYLNTQLESEKQFLFEVEELKNNFLSLISHDLKTPIAKIQAICDRLISEHSADSPLNADLSSLREVATELHSYIKTILQITRVEARDFRINKDASDINEIIEKVSQQLEPLAKQKKIKLSLSLEPMFLIEVDSILIHEVILNLIDNAIKYTPDGGTVKVSSQEVDDQVLVMVEDTGPGIPPEEQARIFEKFFRGELGKSQPKGSGLGLYLVKYFVELHNGKVFLDSSAKTGTKVGFSLPIEEEPVTENISENESTELGDPLNDFPTEGIKNESPA
jgi:two-component system phosphate regulon sensor histidine kinase PhoR